MAYSCYCEFFHATSQLWEVSLRAISFCRRSIRFNMSSQNSSGESKPRTVFCVFGGLLLVNGDGGSALWARFRRRVDQFASSVTMIAYRNQNAHVAGMAKK